MIADVTRSCCADSELGVVGCAVRIALCPVVAPQAIGSGRSLSVEQSVSVLHFQEALVRSIHIGIVRLLFKKTEILVVDGRQLRVVRRSFEGHQRIFPTVVAKTRSNRIISVRVALIDVELSDVPITEEVVAVAHILHALEALRVVRHDLVKHVFQSGCGGFVLCFCKSLRELRISTPVVAGHVQVVFPIHQ